MEVVDNLKKVNDIITQFNSNHNIREVVGFCTGINIKGKSMCCPIHGGDNKHGASVDDNKNIFSCWTGDCGRGLTPWNFIKTYYKLDKFKEVVQKVNSLFNEHIPVYEKRAKKEPGILASSPGTQQNYDIVYNIDNGSYISNCKPLYNDIISYKHTLLKAQTGLGKTKCIVDFNLDSLNDYNIILVPTRALTEDVAAEYQEQGYKKFYGNMTELPDSKYIVATYQKAPMIKSILEFKKSLDDEGIFHYSIIIDECHELMSKRNILGVNICNCIEDLIKDSDISILMSANTDNIYRAYKDKNLFNKYICVQNETVNYNTNNLTLKRLPGGLKQKRNIIVSEIYNALKTHNKVLLMENSKSNLEEYSSILDKKGIKNVVINSENKNMEEVQEHYESIVKNSLIDIDVVLCTSTINAGVNIKNNESICTMVIQDRFQIDTDQAEQFFGRIRTDNNNSCYYYLTQGENERKFTGSVENNYKYYKSLADIKAEKFNIDFFNRYGFEVEKNKAKIIAEFKLYMSNEKNQEIQGLIYYDTNKNIFVVDDVAVWEKARIKLLKDNYYDNEFILNQLKGVKAREFNTVTVAPVTVEQANTEPKSDIDINMKDCISDILKSDVALEEFKAYIYGIVKPKDLKQDENILIYDKFKKDKNYLLMIKELKNIVKAKFDFKIADNGAIDLIKTIMLEFAKKQTKKERDSKLRDIKIKEIYNKKYKLNTSQFLSDDTEIIGDYSYYLVRKYCDCYAVNYNEVSKKTINIMIMELFKSREKQLISLQEQGKQKKALDINKMLEQEIISTVKATYNLTDNKRLISLK